MNLIFHSVSVIHYSISVKPHPQPSSSPQTKATATLLLEMAVGSEQMTGMIERNTFRGRAFYKGIAAIANASDRACMAAMEQVWEHTTNTRQFEVLTRCRLHDVPRPCCTVTLSLEGLPC